jgi:hypothetical protein
MKQLLLVLGGFISLNLGAQSFEIAEAYFPENGNPVEFSLTNLELQNQKMVLNQEEYTFHQAEVLCNGDLKITYQQKWGLVQLFVRKNQIFQVLEYPTIGATVAYELQPESTLPSEVIRELDPRLHLHLEKGWLLYNP